MEGEREINTLITTTPPPRITCAEKKMHLFADCQPSRAAMDSLDSPSGSAPGAASVSQICKILTNQIAHKSRFRSFSGLLLVSSTQRFSIEKFSGIFLKQNPKFFKIKMVFPPYETAFGAQQLPGGERNQNQSKSAKEFLLPVATCIATRGSHVHSQAQQRAHKEISERKATCIDKFRNGSGRCHAARCNSLDRGRGGRRALVLPETQPRPYPRLYLSD